MNDRAATFRDRSGAIVGTTWGGTICWYPRKPSKLAAVSPDGEAEHVIRCGWCPGCRELDRRRLADRLVEWSKKPGGDLWAIVVECDLEFQAAAVNRCRRIASFGRVAGFYRLDADHVALLVRGARPRPRVSRGRRPINFSILKVRLSRGRRAFDAVTRGMLVSRDEWGEWRKRFYHRGLPREDRAAWLVTTTGGIRKRHAEVAEGVRGVRGEVSLFPPAAWLPPRLAKRKGAIERRTRDPISVGNVIGDLLARLRPDRELQSASNRRARSAHINPPAQPVREVMTGGGGVAGEVCPPYSAGHNGAAAVRRTFAKTGSFQRNEAGYQGSKHSSSADADAWLARMRAVAERKAKDEKLPDD